jgi:hypothetical protein
MTNQLEGLNRLREYYLGKLDAYENAMKLVDPRFSDTIKGIINDVKASIAFYDREIAKFKEGLTSK